MIRCIVAIDEKRGLADDNGIPWELPTDQKFFVDQTAEGLILMGKQTYLEFKSPMHDRTNYVATRSTEPLRPGFVVVNDMPAFFEEHKDELINNIGGAGLFMSTLQFADELLLTQVQGDFRCTKFFPPYEQDFERTNRSDPSTENGITFCFETWQRKH